jgi:histidyl-tRNA synthetase
LSRVRVNDRRLLYGVFEEELGIKDPLPVYRAIDKLDKIGLEGVAGELQRLGMSGLMVEKILKLIELRGDPAAVLSEVGERYGGNRHVSVAIRHLEEMFDLLEHAGVVELDMSLARGLDYYTGPIMEAAFRDQAVGSIAGGGRYDGLIGMFTGTDIPATGVSIGIERIIDVGLATGIYTLDRKTSTQAQVVVLDRKHFKYAWRVASVLRRGGVRTRIDLGRTGHRVQVKKAKRLGIPVIVFIGEREEREGTVTIYHTRTGSREECSLEEAARRVREAV